MVDRMSSTQLAGHANNYEYDIKQHIDCDIKLCGADSIMNRVVDVGIIINMVVLIMFESIMLGLIYFGYIAVTKVFLDSQTNPPRLGYRRVL